MKFRNRYSERKVVFSDPGERFKPTYSLRINDDGREELVQTGAIDMHEEIQSHHDSVCLENVLARFQMGDETVLDKVQGFYDDVSSMPVKLQDVLNMARAGEEIFLRLPTEIKETFGNSYLEFINSPDRYKEAYEKYAGISAEEKTSVPDLEKESVNDD